MASTRELPPEIQHKLMRLQQMRDQLQTVILRRQQLELELREVEQALSELEKLDSNATVYKSTGVLLFKADKDKLVTELTDKKETLDLRVKTLQRQEETAKKQFEEYRKVVMESLPAEGAEGAGG